MYLFGGVYTNNVIQELKYFKWINYILHAQNVHCNSVLYTLHYFCLATGMIFKYLITSREHSHWTSRMWIACNKTSLNILGNNTAIPHPDTKSKNRWERPYLPLQKPSELNTKRLIFLTKATFPLTVWGSVLYHPRPHSGSRMIEQQLSGTPITVQKWKESSWSSLFSNYMSLLLTIYLSELDTWHDTITKGQQIKLYYMPGKG